jgi:hypothetical protein
MKQMILNNWHFMRLLRLALGIFIIVQAFITKDWTLGVLGTLFAAMPLFNIGCCGTGACEAPQQKAGTSKEIRYEEVV